MMFMLNCLTTKKTIANLVGSGAVSYGMKAIVNMCLGMIKLMKGR